MKLLSFSILALLAGTTLSTRASVLYSAAGPILANETGVGTNLAGLSLGRGTTASDTLYFTYSVANPQSNMSNEAYLAGFTFFDGGIEKLGIGNSTPAWAYSAYNASSGSVDFNSATPESGFNYQLVRAADTMVFVFRIDFVSGGNDNVTVWLNPNLGLTEAAQNPALKTTFTADATFTEIHLRESGGGSGWNVANISIATSGTDAGFFAVPEPGVATVLLLSGLACMGRRRKLSVA